MPYGVPQEVEETIFQVMAGACSVLQEAGCALVGGHTAEGAELCLGFTVNVRTCVRACVRVSVF